MAYLIINLKQTSSVIFKFLYGMIWPVCA